MSDIAEAIRKKSLILNNIIVHIKDYYVNINEYAWKHASEMLAEYKRLEAILDSYHKNLNRFPKIEEYSIDTLPSLMELYDLWDKIKNTLEKIYVLISDDNVIKFISIGMSQTFISELYMKLSNIKMLFTSLNITYSEINQSIIESAKNTILPAIKTESEENKLTDILVSDGKESDNVVLGFLSGFKPKNPANIKKVEEFSEQLKNTFLSAKGSQNISEALPTEMRLISRFSLLPATEYMSKEALVATCKGQILTINKYTTKPMQYNIMPLLNLEYVIANDMMTSEMSGLNKKILKRFSIIKELPTTSQSSAKFIDPPKDVSANSIIVECLNDTYYRIMHNGIPNSNDVSSPGATIAKILSGPSDRADKYAKISTEPIFSKCVNLDHLKLMVSYMEKQFKSSSSFSLKEYIIGDYMNLFTKAFNNKVILGVPFIRKTISGVIIGSKNILRNRMLLYVFDISMKTDIENVNISDMIDTEALLTFVVKFESAYKEFSREMFNQLNSVIDSGIITNQKTDVPEEQHKNILFACNKIISGAVDSMDTKPSRWTNMDITIKNVAISTGLF
jgi:hypothetical protein